MFKSRVPTTLFPTLLLSSFFTYQQKTKYSIRNFFDGFFWEWFPEIKNTNPCMKNKMKWTKNCRINVIWETKIHTVTMQKHLCRLFLLLIFNKLNTYINKDQDLHMQHIYGNVLSKNKKWCHCKPTCSACFFFKFSAYLYCQAYLEWVTVIRVANESMYSWTAQTRLI